MERLIRKILNYDANSATAEDRDEMCVTVAAISMFLLEKSGKYKDVDTMDIVHKPELKIGRGFYGDGKMELTDSIFRYNETILDDIAIIAHESCHKFQGYRIDDKYSLDVSNTLMFYPTSYDELLGALIDCNNLGDFKPNMNQSEIFSQNDDVRDVCLYFKSFYELQSFEMEANDFSVSVFKYIIESAKKMKLSEVEQSNFNRLVENFTKLNNYYNYRDYLIGLRQDKYCVKYIGTLIDNVRKCIFNEFPNLLKKSKNHTSFYLDNKDDFFNLYRLCLSLEVSFDENLARKIFNYLIVVQQNEDRDFLLFSLAFRSKFKISIKDEKLLRQFHANTKSDYKILSFEKLLSEKERIFAEREAIENDEFDKKYSFNFE